MRKGLRNIIGKEGNFQLPPNDSETVAEMSARCLTEGELMYERSRREALDQKVKEMNTKINSIAIQARKLVNETQKKNPNVARLAMTINESLSNLTKGKNQDSENTKPIDATCTEEVNELQNRITSLTNQNEKLRAEIEKLRPLQEEIKTFQREKDDLIGEQIVLQQEKEELLQHFKITQELAEEENRQKSDRLIELTSKLDEEYRIADEKREREEQNFMEMKNQLAEELSAHHDRMEKLKEDNSALRKENMRLQEENRIKEAQCFNDQASDDSMKKWYGTLEDGEKIENLESDDFAPHNSVIWKQRELIIRLIRRIKNHNEDKMTMGDELKRKIIALHCLQNRVEDQSHELNIMKNQQIQIQAQAQLQVQAAQMHLQQMHAQRPAVCK